MLQAIYVINLDRRPDRYAVVRKQLQASDLRDVPLHRVSAQDSSLHSFKHLLSPVAAKEFERLEKSGLREHHSQLTGGAMGCYLSHCDVWMAVAESGGRDQDVVLILEDDATVPARGLFKIEKRLKKMQAYGIDFSARTCLPWIVFWELICLSGCDEYDEDSSAPFEPKEFWSTQAYSISVGSAKKLMQLSLYPLDVQIDTKLQLLRDEGQLKIYALPFFMNNGTDSDIQVEVVENAPRRRKKMDSSSSSRYTEMDVDVDVDVKLEVDMHLKAIAPFPAPQQKKKKKNKNKNKQCFEIKELDPRLVFAPYTRDERAEYARDLYSFIPAFSLQPDAREKLELVSYREDGGRQDDDYDNEDEETQLSKRGAEITFISLTVIFVVLIFILVFSFSMKGR